MVPWMYEGGRAVKITDVGFGATVHIEKTSHHRRFRVDFDDPEWWRDLRHGHTRMIMLVNAEDLKPCHDADRMATALRGVIARAKLGLGES